MATMPFAGCPPTCPCHCNLTTCGCRDVALTVVDPPHPPKAPGAAVDVFSVCPACGLPALNPTPVTRRNDNVLEAGCLDAAGHIWVVHWNSNTGSESTQQCG